MAIYLVGENIDKSRSHYQAETGKLIRLIRGIYIDASDDAEAMVLQHAVRIANYLYPKAYLSAAGAVYLGPGPDGKLFISGSRNQRTRIRSLEIIQNVAAPSPSLIDAIVGDSIGEFAVKASSPLQRLLESFRRRSEHSAGIDHPMRVALAHRLIAEYSSPAKAADALWALARANAWTWEASQAERFLTTGIDLQIAKNQAQFRLYVAWHGQVVGMLEHDGFEWRWTASEDSRLPLVRQTIPGRLPPFISSLLPEGWLERILDDEDERTLLRTGKRYLSNIVIVEDSAEIGRLPSDILEAPLSLYISDGCFTGTYRGPGKSELTESFERNLANLYKDADTPRLPGVQIKAPMFLDNAGNLTPSTHLPFTHILKPAGTSGFEYLPLIEWQALELARRIGLAVPDSALVVMPNGMPPALLVERFDIRRSRTDQTLLALEDFCSLLDLPAADKYKGTMEQAARALRGVSTDPNADLLLLLQQALFAWLIADGDMHLKNLAVLKTTEADENFFLSVRMAPVYDAVTTVVFPGLKSDLQALKLNGKANKIQRKDYLAFASTIGLRVSDAEQVIEDTLSRTQVVVDQLALPPALPHTADQLIISRKMLETCRSRIRDFQ